MDCRRWMSRLVEYWDTHTHRETQRHSHVHDGAMDWRWWISRLVEYWDTHTHIHLYMMEVHGQEIVDVQVGGVL